MTSLGMGMAMTAVRRKEAPWSGPAWAPEGSLAYWDYQTNQGWIAGGAETTSVAARSLTRAGASAYDRAYTTLFTSGNWRRTSAGLLIEEQSTNRVFGSVPGLTSWALFQMLKTQNAVAVPDGTTTGTTATVNNAGGGSIYIDGVGASIALSGNTVRTQSLLVKAGTRSDGSWMSYATQSYGSGCTIGFNLSTPVITGFEVLGTGSHVASSIRALSGGWYRITVTGTLTNSATNATPFPVLGMGGPSGGTLHLWAMQVNDGLFPMAHIPTTTAAATRDMDDVTEGTDARALMQRSTGTRIITVSDLPTSATACPILSANGSIALLRRKTDGALETTWGGTQATATQTLSNWGGTRKVGISWNAGRVVIGATGAASVGANNTPAAITSVKLGSLSTAALNGLILNDVIYPTFNDTTALDALLV